MFMKLALTLANIEKNGGYSWIHRDYRTISVLTVAERPLGTVGAIAANCCSLGLSGLRRSTEIDVGSGNMDVRPRWMSGHKI